VIDRTALLADLKAEVRSLEHDLRERSASEAEFATALKVEWQAARDAKRTAGTYETWLDDRVTQAAVAWVLATVFVRFCEDNGLIDLPYLAGPGERLAVAVERQQEFFQQHPEMTDRDWIVAGVGALAESEVAAGLFDRAHNPMWTITPSHDAAKVLLAFWRKRGEDGQIVHDFTDPDWGTRFLGDLYQDLSEHAKKTYALLQTPEFVEEFILDYTLEPAVDEFGLDGLRLIDPTCGSGHFLLGAFRRLLEKWEKKAPAVDRWELISRSLGSVHGVDKNPFAAAIARFRLVVAAMKAANVTRLADAPNFSLNIAIGDSLLHGRGAPGIQLKFEPGLFGEPETHTYVTEDIHDYEKSADMLGIGSYHIVVGNPPYITVKDKQENDNYRKAYASCYREYALSVPFAERFFQLAIRGGQDGRGAGYVGQITSNSFMKREFGKKLIEEFFPTIDLAYVVDTSGAFIPGHGTPTEILIARRRWPRKESTIRAVLGVRGEPSEPLDPAKGFVWRAILGQIDDPGSESDWVSVADVPRDRFATHPWSLAGGGAGGLQDALELVPLRLASVITEIGFGAVTREDSAYMIGLGAARRAYVPDSHQRLLVEGETIRNWTIVDPIVSLWPYNDASLHASLDAASRLILWPFRSILRSRVAYGHTQIERGLDWFEYSMFFRKRYEVPLSIAFAFVASHNHFVLDRGEKVFNRSAPVIKLAESATERDHLSLLGVLNSSTACFWLKQVSQDKGNRGGERSTARYAWERFFEFTGARLQEFPLPPDLPLEFGRELDGLASRLNAVEASVVCARAVPTRTDLDAAHAEHDHIRARMIALQEELDWDVYHRYGLLRGAEAAELIADPASVPELKLGQRAFEIVIAPRASDDEAVSQWFARHDSVPVEVIPEDWPEPYRRVVARRIETIKNRRDIALIERPECKRRWQSEPWEKKERAALRTWLLDRCEDRALWFENDGQGRAQPRPMTVNRLADKLRADADMVSVARLLAGPDADLAVVLTEITADEHVPCMAQQRYKEPGLRKRRQWERVWDLQRQEDCDGTRLDIDVPPKYTSADFLRTSYWRNRGKLDVPKERFVSYPGASPDGDNSLLLGWAGWDHREQAHALMTLIDERATRDGWDGERLKPLIAALAEVMPWVRQWHGEVDSEFGTSPAKAYDAFLDEQKLRYGFGSDDLDRWRPEKTGRGRRRAKPTSADDAAAEPDEPQNEAPGEDGATL
jgi:Domain of unknown function (DUF7008)/Eco57I restriction-modification methylase